MNWLSLFDIALLSVILACGFEVVRLLHPRTQPWLALTFVLITVGAFGWIDYDLRGNPVPWFAVVLHAGFALAAALVAVLQRAASVVRPWPTDRRQRGWLHDAVHRW